ncbi:uncharacterized protein KY384_005803 [Bacidia gigantensis]|uniref:uncharacterized protein n=1 Tax=Bacidia gigantensis TaxID=2732470 RepID=UPI001D05552C|nr:uncharacterized protein KY384_005803 [Bacidia gigantensis]KAG8529168.1 hypothetical protein KY384_005803 [Bacidia gigantensis]
MSFLNRRLTVFSLAAKGNEVESSSDVRGPLGLNFLHEPSEPLIDFIFVHGLRGGSRKTWSKSPDPSTFWPREWLPLESRFKNVRISTFGYNSDWGERKTSSLTLHDFGQALLGDIQNTLCSGRAASKTPLVLIGHSMGGIVIKKMLLLARQDPLYHHVAARVHSMFFLATPHRGADSAQLLHNVLKVAVSHGPKAYVDSLMPNSDAIQAINDGFRHVYQGIQLWSFFETVPTNIGLIVEKESAILELPGERVQLLNADHRNVCKFDNPSDCNYTTIRNAFVATIESIEATFYSTQKADCMQEMRLLATYFGLSSQPENDLANITDAQLEGSCQWLTEHPNFLNWRSGLESQPKFFWLTGDPATGKSTMSGHVVRHLEQMNGECSYFFFRHHSGGSSKLAELLCSLAWQMASSNAEIRHALLTMQRDDVPLERTDERSIWRAVFLSRIFRVELRQPHFWIIDAIDECTTFSTFFPFFARMDQQYPLQIFFTSRPSLVIERALSHEQISKHHEILSRDKSLADIALYVRVHASYLPCESDEARESLVQQILEKSNGNFLWTKLVVKELQSAMSEQSIKEILDLVPQEIDELYEKIFEQLMSVPREARLITCIFRWVICASRPLTVDELKEILRLELTEVLPQLHKTLSSLCGNLIFVDSQSRVWLAHQTVREYLRQDNLPSGLSIDRQEAHSLLAIVCLEYLQGEDFKVPKHRRISSLTKQRKPSVFSAYAIQYFSDHVARASASTDSLLTSLDGFLTSTTLVWLELIGTKQDLGPLISTAKNLKTYLERRAKYHAPLGPEIQKISQWTADLVHLVAQHGKAMLTAPSMIAFLIPPICPTESFIYQRFFDFYPRGLRLTGLSQKTWDDRLCCVDFTGTQALSVACRDNKYALGLSNGYVQIYNETSFQEQLRLHHNEPARQLAFGNVNLYLASAGRKRVAVWNTSSGVQLWARDLTALPLAIDFNETDTILMAATRANTLSFWEAHLGTEVDTSQFCDINEEDQTEYHYNRPPIGIKFAASLNLIGIAYRQRPISFWDLEDNSFIGQYHKTGAVYPEPLIHDFAFNPNPDICLAAVAYQSAEVAVFDPFTQHTVAVAAAPVSSLAASPDGSTLVTGSGDGIIKIFEFETLRLLYQIDSYQQDIRALAFNSNNLRILDIRGNQFNIWEPSTLAYRPTSRDDSSLNFTESARGEAEYVANAMFDDDLTVTAIATHQDSKFLFCGRENGTVALYSSSSGLELKALAGHGPNLAITRLQWIDKHRLLLAKDRSGSVSLQRVIRDDSREFQSTLVLPHSGCRASEVLLSPDGDRLLISTNDGAQVWTLDGTDGLARSKINIEKSDLQNSWFPHPKSPQQLLLVGESQIKFFDWLTLQESKGPFLRQPYHSTRITLNVETASKGTHLCVYHAGMKSVDLAPSLRLYPTSQMTSDSEFIGASVSLDDIAQSIKRIVGTHKSQMLYLNHQGWVCSINIDDILPDRFYTRHFFIPLQWHSSTETPVIRVTSNGSIVLAVRDEIAIFHNGLNFEERVGCKGLIVSTKASMRTVMRRGTSQP